jgi:hypothetical protein
MTEKQIKLKYIDDICADEVPYSVKLEAYEYLSENGEDVADEMIKRLYETDGDNAQMLVEILANFKGRDDVYLWLVTYLYRGEDIALFAKLLGSYGDARAIDVLNAFARETQLDYVQFMEVRNAVEQLGGVFASTQNFDGDPLYNFIKGIADDPASYEHTGNGEGKCGVCGEEEAHCVCDDGCACGEEDCGCACGHSHFDDDCGCD